MSSLNKITPAAPIFTHEGARATRLTLQKQLSRSVMSCLLWEKEFYEDGDEIASLIAALVAKNDPEFVRDLAIKARTDMKLRHVPLLLARELARNAAQRHVVADTLYGIIQRPYELSEFLAIYQKDGKEQPLAAQVKKGLARAFTKFNEYALAKYNRDNDIKLRDVLFLSHAKPVDAAQADLWKRLVDNKLDTPDTWEVELSAGKDKKQTFERLINEKKLGGLALLRNLRNMTQAGVSRDLIIGALASMNAERVLPFRFISAAAHAPDLEQYLETAMFKCLEGSPRLKGKTALVIDVSGSMTAQLSGKSDLRRIDAACALGILLREVCEDVRIYTFATSLKEVPARRGFALRDAVMKQFGGSTKMGHSLSQINYGEGLDRLVVISDDQSEDKVNAPKTKGYMLNVASARNAVGIGPWNRIDGWSESIVSYVLALENEGQ